MSALISLRLTDPLVSPPLIQQESGRAGFKPVLAAEQRARHTLLWAIELELEPGTVWDGNV